MPLQSSVRSALIAWVELFMGRSMQDLLHFLKESNSSLEQYVIFIYLYKRGAGTVTEIGDLLNVGKAASSQMISRLVAQGRLARQAHATDRRYVQVVLTPEGRAFAEACIAARYRWLERMPSLTDEQEAAVLAGLMALTEVMREGSAEETR